MKSVSRKILLINPNSSKSMTDGLDNLIKDLNLQGSTSTEIHTYTAPSGPPSINNEDDALESANVVLPDIESKLSDQYLDVAFVDSDGQGRESALEIWDSEEVRRKMMEATKRLVRDKDVKVICLGCAGMAGLDKIVRDALDEELGEDSKHVHILDGVKAGIGLLESLLRALPPRA
ncbi:hypothetical protein M7I_4054 [Glarea lozoyensis 74030]|uniref:Hydantoin racemase n=1 Tax=Glarea lozoyensis (strain ATCC 74030 / MF5533) TaxID=1104152 RepID=H0EN51_GLAL7|nr:hypothetical protein M7I_4054 [Glarea lozoyensis 74030]